LLRPYIYEYAILCGAALLMLGLWLWLSAASTPVEKRGALVVKLVFGSLCVALVAGCRPQMELFAFLAVPIFWPRYIGQKRLPDILLAEDNADFADFFVRHLSGSYTIHCATDGRQALDLLRSRSIAAVVSDVAMKGMDGVALCAAIRNDPALDHLPVVLVSVDSSSAAKVRALEAGADAYLEKPLSVDYLDCQIRALIGIRGRLRLKFSKMPYLVMDGDAASPSGNRFMAQVNQYVMDNISNSNLSVEDIAAAVNVSRTLFFSRIKSLTGTTPNEFLRSTRLRVAAELLSKSNDLRVTEICYMVGFTSTSYFAKCFHAQFGMLPTEFMEKYRRE